MDPQRDPRLHARVSVTAYRTTVGQVLAELTRKTGVRLRPGTSEVREEPIIAFLKPRPLHSVLRLLAEEFAWGPERRYGWFWMRKKGTEPPEYELHKDVHTQRLPEELRLQDRRLFLQDLEQELKEPKRPGRPGVHGIDVMALLPPSAVQGALTGRQVAVPWAQCSPALREMFNTMVASFTTGNERSWVEVSAQGQGRALMLKVMFQPYGRGGMGLGYRPRAYGERYRPTPPFVEVGGQRQPKSYAGLAARPLALTKEEGEKWRHPYFLPELLRFLHEKTGQEILSDDYQYGVDLTRAPIPAGEALGFWLDAVGQKLEDPSTFNRSSQEWREEDGCFLLRNANWYGDDALRPPIALRVWLRELAKKGTPHVLTLAEANRLLSQADEETLWRLEAAGLLRRDNKLGTRRGLFKLWSALDQARLKKLFSPEGLRLTDLTPAQRELATKHGPGREPVITDWIIENNLGGALTMSVRQADGRLDVSYITPKTTLSMNVDLRLPTAKESTEVCQVKLEPENEASPPAEGAAPPK